MLTFLDAYIKSEVGEMALQKNVRTFYLSAVGPNHVSARFLDQADFH